MTTKTDEIRRLLKQGIWSSKEIAFWTGVSQQRVCVVRWRDENRSKDGMSYGGRKMALYRSMDPEGKYQAAIDRNIEKRREKLKRIKARKPSRQSNREQRI